MKTDKNRDKLLNVAQATGTSVSTVSKVLNHCGGVGSDMRESILHFACDGHETGWGGEHDESGFGDDLFVIFPEYPSYYWGALYQAVYRHLAPYCASMRIRFHLYTKLSDDYSVLNYLTAAEENCPRAILMAAPDNPVVNEKIMGLIDRGVAVFFAGDGPKLRGSFCIYGNPVRDTSALVEKLLTDLPGAGHIWVVGKAPERLAGVTAALNRLSAKKISVTVPSDWSDPLLPAVLAREITAIHGKCRVDAVICLDGITSKVCLALKKSRLSIPCYGFENDPMADLYVKSGMLRGQICQDLEACAEKAVQVTVDYLQKGIKPGTGLLYVPALQK